MASATTGAGLDQYLAEVQALEALGFDTMWLSDIPLGAGLDPLVGLSFAAAATSSLKLGANLVPIGRNPLTLAKSLAQIDQLSGGRLLLSFVVGLDQPGERQALGSAGANRGALLEEVTPAAADLVGRRPGDLRQRPLPLRPACPRPAGPASSPWRCGLAAAGQPPWPAPAAWPTAGWDRRCRRPKPGRPASGSSRPRRRPAEPSTPSISGSAFPYTTSPPDQRTLDQLRARRPDANVADLIPVGPDHLRRLVSQYVDAGISKFVVRGTGQSPDPDDRLAALKDLADLLLPLQT